MTVERDSVIIDSMTADFKVAVEAFLLAPTDDTGSKVVLTMMTLRNYVLVGSVGFNRS